MLLMKVLAKCRHVKQYLLIYITNGLSQCFQNIFAHGLLLASKNNHGLSHPCSHKYGMCG